MTILKLICLFFLYERHPCVSGTCSNDDDDDDDDDDDKDDDFYLGGQFCGAQFY